MTGYVYAAPAGGGLPPRGRWIAAGETDEGKVREQSGRLIPTCPVRQVPGRCGHRPLREGLDFSLNRARRMFQRSAPHPSGPLALPPSPEGKAAYRRGTLYSSPPWTCRGPLHTRRCGGTLGKHRGQGFGGRVAVPGLTPYRPTPVRAYGPATLSQERVGDFPSSVRASPCHLPRRGRRRLKSLIASPRFLPPFLYRPRCHG